ncbi:protein cholesin isoform 3-T5 [Menidia menidia]
MRSKELCVDVRNKIVSMHKDGEGYKKIASALEVPRSTVVSIIRKWKTHGTTDSLPRCGRPSKLSHQMVSQLPESSGCTKETRELEEEEDDDLMGELSPEERRVLERKMKKILKKEEKKRLIADGETMKKVEAAGPSASQLALDYLTCWAENRSVWRFQKTRQTWLLQHMFDSEKIPEEKFPVLLEYLEGLQGAAKDTTVQKALSLVEESGRAPDDSVVQQRACRAREVIQLFS